MKKSSSPFLKNRALRLVAVVVIMAVTLGANAQNWNQIVRVAASDIQSGDQYGWSVAIDGDNAIVGSWNNDYDVNGQNYLNNSGAAYILKKVGNNWVQQQKLTADVRATDPQFGVSVDISGDYAIVSATSEDYDATGSNYVNDAGAAYIYHNVGGTWTLQQKIVSGDRNPLDHFGLFVALEGNYAVVGAHYDDQNPLGGGQNDAGAAYVFYLNNGSWTQQQKLVAGNYQPSALFGQSVAISGDRIIVGAVFDQTDVNGANVLGGAGAAYVFVRSGTTWTQEAKLVASDRAANDFFGLNVAISGNYAVVGAEYSDPSGMPDAGAAYVYHMTSPGTWVQQQKLTAGNKQGGDRFGFSVAIDGATIAVGAIEQSYDPCGTYTGGAGATYVYSLVGSTWQEQQQLYLRNAFGGHFGYQVSISGGDIMVGAPDYSGGTVAFCSYTSQVYWSASYGYWDVPCNWSTNLVPTAADNVFIPSNSAVLVQNANAIANNLTIDANTNLFISDYALTINGVLSNEGSVSVYSGGGYLSGNSGSYTGTGYFLVNTISNNAADGYRDLSSPVNTTVGNLSSYYPVVGQDGVNCWYAYAPYPNVQVYDEALSLVNGNYYEGWKSYTGLSNPLSALKGVAFRVYPGSPFSVTFAGLPYNGTQSTAITKTSSATPSQDGWNFVGNPYPSNIDWVAVAALNPGITGSYYVFQTTGEYSGSWGTCNAAGVCAGSPAPSRYISATQGFFVKATGNGSFTMNNSVRVANNSNYYKTDAINNEVRLSLTNGVNSDEIVAYTDANATEGNDQNLDAEKMAAGSTTYISYKMQDVEYAIDVIPAITEQTELPLVIWAQQDGNYTLNANLNVPGYAVYLKDNQTGALVNLAANSPVLALSANVTYEGRYSIVFKEEETTGFTVEENLAKIYTIGAELFVARQNTGKATITLTNMLGQQLAEITTANKIEKLDLTQFSLGYVVVKVTENGKSKTSKILIHE